MNASAQEILVLTALIAGIHSQAIRLKIMQMMFWFGPDDTTQILWRALRRMDDSMKRGALFDQALIDDINYADAKVLAAHLRCMAGDRVRLWAHQEPALTPHAGVLIYDALCG